MHEGLPEQFKAFVITPLVHVRMFGFDFAFTNSALLMLIGIVVWFVLFRFALRREDVIPGKIQWIAEAGYQLVYQTLNETIGPKGRIFTPLVMTIFYFVLWGNLGGFLPKGFSFTTHIVVTFTLAFFVFLISLILGIVRNGWRFLQTFLPPGIPLLFSPVIFIIEVFSYFIRPITLSVRLTANMMVGHLLLGTIGTFVVSLGLILGLIPFLFLFPIIALEFIVSFIQAYVFIILTCIYINDSYLTNH